MDKNVIFAVAGSGKTSRLVAELNETQRFLIVTYTESNYDNLRRKIIERFGFFPTNITLYTYFKFLHGFCYRPFLRSKLNTKGILFERPQTLARHKLTDPRYYMTPNRWLYANRLAKLIQQADLTDAVIARMEKYFDVFFVDEVQDFAGHDFNFLMAISAAKLKLIHVGDFFQHTFDTSLDGNVNARLHDDYTAYTKKFKTAKINIDSESLKKSRRCSKTVCDFITKNVGIPIEAQDERETSLSFEDDPEKVLALYKDQSTVKLFYQNHHKYRCYSQNWGASKGIDTYDDVCVVLSPANVKAWQVEGLGQLNVKTRNKLYVACTRARGNLTFIPESLLKAYMQP
jgi:DNA helicase II / ATP-dependent DNA helicase PcrA